MARPQTIAIDGPGAAGKNTVGLLLARRLGYVFIDTGAMYRGVTLRVMQTETDFADTTAIVALAATARFTFASSWEAMPAGTVFMNGQEVTHELHSPDVDRWVSRVASIPEVRTVLIMEQRRLAQEHPVVMVGRDIGSVVLPDADLKLYLDASPEQRAYRRFHELRGRGEPVDYAQVLADLERRDRLDNATTPLEPPPDAAIIHTDNLSPDEVVTGILAAIDEDGENDGDGDEPQS